MALTAQQLAAAAKDISKIPEALALESEGYMLFYLPGTGWQKIQKSKIVFAGEPPSKSIHLEDMPSSLTGQSGKTLVVNAAGTDYEFKLLSEVQGVTKAIIEEALQYVPVKSVNNVLADANGNVQVQISGPTTSPTELIRLTTNWQQGTLNYKPYAEWKYNNVLKSFSGDRTADPADPTYARYDLWYIDLITETVEIKKGTPSANPERPSVDDPVNQLDTGIFIHILAGATTPEGVTGEIVYAENAAGEYPVTSTSTIDPASTNTPHSGSVNLEVTSVFMNQGGNINFDCPTPLDPTGKELAYWIKNKAGGPHHWTFVGPSVKNGRVIAVSVASPGNYDPNSTAWQAQSVAFPTGLSEVTSFRIVADFTGFSIHLDDIRVVGGGGTVVVQGVDKAYVDQKAAETLQAAKDYADSLGGGSSSTPPANYDTIALMLADQENQVENEEYTVADASGWTAKSLTGWATFQKKAASTGAQGDYTLRENQTELEASTAVVGSSPNTTIVNISQTNTSQENADIINSDIQAAIPTKGTIIIPEGEWIVNTINWDNRITIQGSGTWGATKLYSAAAEPLIKMTNTSLVDTWGNLSNLYLDGKGVGTIGLDLMANVYFNYDKIDIRNFTQYGIKTVSHILGTFTRFRVRYCPIGWYCRETDNIEYGNPGGTPQTGYMASNFIILRDCYFNNCSTFVIDKDKGAGLILDNCDLEGNGTAGNEATGLIKFTNMAEGSQNPALILNGCWTEMNNGVLYQLGTAMTTKAIIQNTIHKYDDSLTKYFQTTGNLTVVLSHSSFLTNKILGTFSGDLLTNDTIHGNTVYLTNAAKHKTVTYGEVSTAVENPVALHYALEGTTSEVVDANGNYNGTLTGTVTRGVTGQVGNCFQFTDGEITILHDSDFSLYDGANLRNIAFEFYVNFNTVGDTWFFHKRIGTPGEAEYQLSYYQGILRWQMWNTDGTQYQWTKAVSFAAGQFYHIKGFSDLANSGFTVLIDEVNQAGTITGTVTTPKTTTQNFVIANDWNGVFPLIGKLDEFKLWVKDLPAWAV